MSNNAGVFCYKNHLIGIRLMNGWEVRAGFGPKNLCNNFNMNRNELFPLSFATYQSPDAEIFVFKDGIECTATFFAQHMEGVESKNASAETLAHVISIIQLLD